MTTETIKTYANWNRSLSEYLQVGDITDEEMYWQFVNVLPPVTMRSDCTQMGEPYSHVNGRATYATLKQVSDNTWMFCGYCHKGQNTEPTKEQEADKGLYTIKFVPSTACLMLLDGEEIKDHIFFSKYAYENGIFNSQDMEHQAHILASQNGVHIFQLDLSQF